MSLTHLDDSGQPRMVDVSEKKITPREAIASGIITMSPAAFATAKAGSKKGPVIHTAILAAINAAKLTPSLIPLAHPLPLSKIEAEVEELAGEGEGGVGFKFSLRVSCEGKTGVEMEALTGVSLGLLTIYDMLKAIDRSMQIGQIRLEKKSGGASGVWEREGGEGGEGGAGGAGGAGVPDCGGARIQVGGEGGGC